MALTPKQERFVSEYLLDLNATQAAVRAGYSKKTAKSQGARLLTFVDVRAAIDARQAKRAAKAEVKGDDVLRELQTFGHLNPKEMFDEEGRLLHPKDMPDHVARAIASFEVEKLFEGKGDEREQIGTVTKVKLWNKPQGLELLGKHVQLFGDHPGNVTNIFQVENHQLTLNLDFSRLSEEEHEQLLALMEKATPAAE